MYARLLSLFCVVGLLVLLGQHRGACAAPLADEVSGQTDEKTLRSAGLGTDGPALLKFLRERSQPAFDRDKLTALIRQLGDKTPATRDRAAGEIVTAGNLAIPLLREALKDPDEQEIASGAQRCLMQIEGKNGSALAASTVRLLAVRRPEGAAEAMLAFLPFADDDSVVEEIRIALSTLAWNDGKANPVLVAALEDRAPIRRAVAAEALCRAGGIRARQFVLKLLQDPKPTVRLHAALALAELREEKAVAALIALMDQVPPVQAKQAEEYLVNLFGGSGPKATLDTTPASRQKCRAAWTAWWLDMNKAALLDEFRKRTLTDADREAVLALIRQLGNESFDKREKALADLQERGTAVVALLRQAVDNPDAEIGHRARRCLQRIEKDRAAALPVSTIRLVALRKPPGAVEALLAFVPFAEDETMRAEVQSALLALATRGDRPDPALVAALKDKVARRRIAAAEVLCRAGRRDQFQAIKKLLKDDDADTRLRVALALIGANDKDGVPALIDLLAEAPADLAGQAEESLRLLAGTKAPEIVLGKEQADRQKCREAWNRWWRDQGQKIDLARTPGRRELGYTLMVLYEIGTVVEIGRDGKERWQLTGLMHPFDARLLPGDRVLIAEYNGFRVTERNLKNEVLWEKQVNNPISAQRLANGNTFIACRNQLIEVDRTGKELFTFNRPRHDIMAAQRLRDGQIVCALRTGSCLVLDATGKEVKSFTIGPAQYNCMDAQPNGRVLIAHTGDNRVIEYDREGKTHWEATVPQPSSVMCLPNGNVLVASYQSQQVVELNRSGKIVWTHKTTNGQPWVARRR